jgi:hypothetical protein
MLVSNTLEPVEKPPQPPPGVSASLIRAAADFLLA